MVASVVVVILGIMVQAVLSKLRRLNIGVRANGLVSVPARTICLDGCSGSLRDLTQAVNRVVLGRGMLLCAGIRATMMRIGNFRLVNVCMNLVRWLLK